MPYSQVDRLPPPSFVLVPASAFTVEWEARPREEQAVGLRLVSQSDIETARAQARERAMEAVPDVTDYSQDQQAWIDAFNDALMGHIVAMAMCDPNDVEKPWAVIKAAPEDIVRRFMTPGAIKHVYDAWERMRIGLDPVHPEATDEDIARLPALMAECDTKLSTVRAARVRRLLAFVLEELGA
jgi:hypothetical protein